MKKLTRIQKEFQILNCLKINIAGKEQIIHQKKMIGKHLRKKIEKFRLYIIEKKIHPAYISKHNL